MLLQFQRLRLVLALCLGGALFCSAQQSASAQQHAAYITYTIQKSLNIFPAAINNEFTVAGYYNTETAEYGYVRDICGKIDSFQVGTLVTQVSGINDRGEVIGAYQNVSGEQGGFIRTAKGVVTTFAPGGATGVTTPTGINNQGLVTGYYATNNGGVLGPYFGFVRYPDGGIVTFNATKDTTYTTPQAINAPGAVTGSYFFDNNTQVGGFVREPDGYSTTFQYQQGIVPTSINARGTITGWYGPNSGSTQAFLRSAQGKITPVTLPGPVSNAPYNAPRIDAAGEVTGSYTVTNTNPNGPSQLTYGFLRARDGKIVSFAVPGTGVSATTPANINDFGVVTGTYVTKTGAIDGFLRIPY